MLSKYILLHQSIDAEQLVQQQLLVVEQQVAGNSVELVESGSTLQVVRNPSPLLVLHRHACG